MSNIVFMPGVPIPAKLAADHDPQVAAMLEDIAAGRIGLNTHECQGAWSPEDVANLHAALSKAFGPKPDADAPPSETV